MRQLLNRYPQLASTPDIAGRLHTIFHRMGREHPAEPIYMAREAVIAAHALMPTAIISSSYRENIEQTIRQMGIEDHVTYYAGADDYADPKPAPDGFLKAAGEMQVAPEHCLVFEDSMTGIQAAKSAGMRVVTITHRSYDESRATELADLAITDYSELDKDFFSVINGRMGSA